MSAPPNSSLLVETLPVGGGMQLTCLLAYAQCSAQMRLNTSTNVGVAMRAHRTLPRGFLTHFMATSPGCPSSVLPCTAAMRMATAFHVLMLMQDSSW